MQLNYLYSAPQTQGRLKAEFADFIVREELGYELTGEESLWQLKFVKPMQTLSLSAKN